jgi:hypothetical protein
MFERASEGNVKRKLLRILGVTLGVVVIVAAGLGGLFIVVTHKFNPVAPEAHYPVAQNALEAQRQDLDYFAKLIAMDRAYSPAARAKANRRLGELARSTAVLDRGHMRVALMEIAALADNGHTGANSKKPSRPKILPIRLSAFSDGIRVMRAKAENSDLLGAEVVAIDGRPIDQVLDALKNIRGGTDAWRKEYAEWSLNSSELLYGLGIAPADDRSIWTFRQPGGETVERVLKGYQPEYDEPAPDLWRWMSPLPIKDDKRKWEAFSPTGWRAPLTLQDPDRIFRFARISGACVALLQMKANEDTNGQSIGAFLKATEADLEASKPCAIIFDNRYNGGGDYTNTAGFGGRLPSLVQPGGKIYMLTGPDTFSAGITTTVFVKQAAAPGQVVILGEPVGDRMAFYAEGGRGCLPNGPFCFHYATGMHDYAHPCTDWDRCYWLNWIYPARTDSLKPAMTIRMSFADYLAGRDPAFDRALAMASR